eukprot:sb/3477222/
MFGQILFHTMLVNSVNLLCHQIRKVNGWLGLRGGRVTGLLLLGVILGMVGDVVGYEGWEVFGGHWAPFHPTRGVMGHEIEEGFAELGVSVTGDDGFPGKREKEDFVDFFR